MAEDVIKQKKRKKDRKHYLKYRDRYLKKAKKYREENRDKVLDYKRKYYQEQEHIDEHNAYQKQYYEEHKDEYIQACSKRASKKYHATKEKLYVILTPEGQTPCCAVCGLTDGRFFEIHHINGDGKEDRQKHGKIKVKKYYVEHPDEARQQLQILCVPDHKNMLSETHAMRKRRKEVIASYEEEEEKKNKKVGGFSSSLRHHVMDEHPVVQTNLFDYSLCVT